MGRINEYFGMIKSKWIPDNQETIFAPFIFTVVYENDMHVTNAEEISNSCLDKFGFSIPVFLIEHIIKAYSNKNYFSLARGQITFNIDNFDPTDLLDSKEIEIEKNKFDNLIKGFINFCNDLDFMDKEKAEQTLRLFVNRYDTSIIKSMYDFNQDEDNNSELYFFMEYIKNIFENDSENYQTLVNVCEGNLIKSMIFIENVDSSELYKGQKIFIDTPVIFRVLGYYGSFLEQEYIFLMNSWMNMGGEVYVFDNSLVEVDNVLSSAERWVESSSIDITKTSEVCLYFRKMKFSKYDVQKESLNVKEKLESLGIQIYSKDIPLDESIIQDEEEIKNEIKLEYKHNEKNIKEFIDDYSIDMDVRSVSNVYRIRSNNSVTKLNETNALLITNNRGLIAAISRHHAKYFPKTLPPIIKDSYFGMLITSQNIKLMNEYIYKNIIAICHSAFKPTQKIKTKYIDIVQELKSKDKVTDKEFLLLRNYPYLNELLTQETRGFTIEIDDTVVYDLLSEIKNDYTKQELLERDVAHKLELERIEQEKNEEILKIKKQSKYDLFVLAKNQIRRVYKKYNIISSMIFIVIIAAIIAEKIISSNWTNWISWLVSGIILLGISGYQIYTMIKFKTNILAFFINKKRKEILNFHHLSDEEYDDFMNNEQ